MMLVRNHRVVLVVMIKSPHDLAAKPLTRSDDEEPQSDFVPSTCKNTTAPSKNNNNKKG